MPFGPAVAVGKRNLVRSARRNPSTTVARRFGEARIAIRAGNDADRHTIAMRQREFGGGVVARRQSTDPVGTAFANQTLPSGPSVTMFRGRDAALADNEPSGGGNHHLGILHSAFRPASSSDRALKNALKRAFPAGVRTLSYRLLPAMSLWVPQEWACAADPDACGRGGRAGGLRAVGAGEWKTGSPTLTK